MPTRSSLGTTDGGQFGSHTESPRRLNRYIQKTRRLSSSSLPGHFFSPRCFWAVYLVHPSPFRKLLLNVEISSAAQKYCFSFCRSYVFSRPPRLEMPGNRG